MEYNFNQISKTLEKIFSSGFNTERKILAMKLEDLDKITNLQAQEALIIVNLKKAIKNKKIIEFLSGNDASNGL